MTETKFCTWCSSPFIISIVLRAIDQERSRGAKRGDLHRKAVELSKKHIAESLAVSIIIYYSGEGECNL